MTIKGTPVNVYDKARFILEVDGIEYAGFTTCSEIGGEIGVIEHREGGRKEAFKKDGNVTFPELTLERGFSENRELWEWWKGIRDGTITGDEKRRTARLVQQDEAKQAKVALRLANAWPRVVRYGGWDNNADEAVYETCILVYEDLEREELD